MRKYKVLSFAILAILLPETSIAQSIAEVSRYNAGIINQQYNNYTNNNYQTGFVLINENESNHEIHNESHNDNKITTHIPKNFASSDNGEIVEVIDEDKNNTKTTNNEPTSIYDPRIKMSHVNPQSMHEWIDLVKLQAENLEENRIWAKNELNNFAIELEGKLEKARMNGQPFLLWVNIPSYTLRVYDTSTGELKTESKVIVGARGTQTPIFETNVINLKYNPDWSPPASLQRKGKIYTPPGPNNPLGQVRFSTDNNMSIYLHDTNNHSLFDKDMRALSAGCVRVNKWQELAQVLSGDDAETVLKKTEGNKINFQQIPKSLVWVSYQRLDLDSDNRLKIYPDVYRKQSIK